MPNLSAQFHEPERERAGAPDAPDAPEAQIAGVTAIKDRLAGATGMDIGHAVLAFLIVDAFVMIVLCAALAPRALLFIVPVVALMPFVAGGFVNLFFWSPWARRYPARPQSPDALVKKNQSFTLGRGMRLNHAMHLAADERHLHLIPIALLRWGGSRVISLPWEKIENPRPTRGLLASEVRATIDGRTIAGPEWCMRLAVTDARTTAESPIPEPRA